MPEAEILEETPDDIRKFIQNIDALNSSDFKYDLRTEGFKDFKFGCRAGPSVPEAMNLAHEIAHAVEFEDKRRRRWNMFGWGFKSPKRFIFNRFVVEPNTYQMTCRESRTFAIQKHLLEMADISSDCVEWNGTPLSFYDYAAKLNIDWLPDWYCVPGETKEERFEFCKNLIIEYYNSYTKEQISQRLSEVVKYIAKRRKRFEKRTAAQNTFE